jgi:hypothetical protein
MGVVQKWADSRNIGTNLTILKNGIVKSRADLGNNLSIVK